MCPFSLLLGKVFTNVIPALAFHSKKHNVLLEVISEANLLSRFNDVRNPFNGTLLAPSNDVLKAMAPGQAPGQLVTLLNYHMLPEAVYVPLSVQAKKPFSTGLKGLRVTFSLGM
jgi:hypothetical protein